MRSFLKRKWFWLAMLTLLGIIGAGSLLIPAPRISQANCDKIQLGWNCTQAEKLLGKPDGVGFLDEWPCLLWSDDDDAQILVLMNVKPDETVCYKRYSPSNQPFFELFKNRLKRQIMTLWP